jgi:hypothetical protein
MQIKKGLKGALLGGLGGAVGTGLKMVAEPSLMKDTPTVISRFWVVPVVELVASAVVGSFAKGEHAGAGLAGSGLSHLIENANMAIAAKRNTTPAPANTAGYDETGALVDPRRLTGANTGWMSAPSSDAPRSFADTGSLVMPGQI